MTILNEGPRTGEALIAEAEMLRSRDEIVVMASQTLLASQVLGKAASVATVAAAVAGGSNTGNGTVTLAGTPFTGAVMAGTYRVVFSAATRYSVFNPAGELVGTGATGAAFSNHLAFTIAAGATPFAAGDIFTIGVTAVSYRYGAYDPAATDGRAVPAGVLIYPITTAAGETAKAAAWVRAAVFNENCLQWLTGLNTTQKAAAIAMMNANPSGLTVRK